MARTQGRSPSESYTARSSVELTFKPGLLAGEIGMGVVELLVALPVADDCLAARASPWPACVCLVTEAHQQIGDTLLVLGFKGAAKVVGELVRRAQAQELVGVRVNQQARDLQRTQITPRPLQAVRENAASQPPGRRAPRRQRAPCAGLSRSGAAG